MTNIFNLFLFLLTLWAGFIFVGNNFNLPFIIFGVISSLIVAIISYQLNLINKKSELLYLSLGFYKHFVGLYFKNFYSSISLLIELASSKKSLHPTLHNIEIKENFRFNHTLLSATINMSTGIFVIGNEKNNLLIHAIHEDYFYEFDLLKNVINLNNVNDDNLI